VNLSAENGRSAEAKRFLKEFGKRLAKFGLELHPEKTRLIEFGPNAARECGRGAKGSQRVSRFWGLRIVVEPPDRAIARSEDKR
jgi:hypothetical protein